MQKLHKYVLMALVALVYLFLYLPIFVLILFSFNKNPFTQAWEGFTLIWYYQLFASPEIWDALLNSIIVATSTVFCSISMGLLFVFFVHSAYATRLLMLFYLPLAVPEMVLAVSLLSFFSYIASPLGVTTLIAGHTLLALGYVVPILYTRYHEIDVRIFEAARDLGAGPFVIFRTIIVPLLRPSMIAAGLLVFIVSLDDFLISFFCAGPTVQTLPLFIFSTIRSGATPVINALSTLLLVVSGFAIFIVSIVQLQKVDEGS